MQQLSNGSLAVDVATAFGPRIMGLTPAGSTNLFADLGDLGIDLDGGRRYVFYGGHRLWLAPEVADITYEPEDGPVTVESASATRVVVAARIGDVEKAIDVTLEPDRSVAVIEHSITSRSPEPIALAPWAITQFRTGGTAILPYNAEPADEHGLQASHALVGWPYTDWDALSYDPSSRVIHVDGARATPTKIGTSLDRGWLAYVIDGWVFAKFAEPVARSNVDLGAQAEIYANASFVELETLGPLVMLEHGESVTHREMWRVEVAPASLSDVPDMVELWREDL